MASLGTAVAILLATLGNEFTRSSWLYSVLAALGVVLGAGSALAQLRKGRALNVFEGLAALGVEVSCFQSNHEGQLIEWVHEAADCGCPVIINPGGFTHTSVALRDALVELECVIEVHISNVHAREPFRQHSYISPIARGVIAGLGVRGYLLALEYLCASEPVQ